MANLEKSLIAEELNVMGKTKVPIAGDGARVLIHSNFCHSARNKEDAEHAR